ncbi:hypothetical protein SERLA73DRAFT_111801 [Serpula lacrymans var. lacrymans S7.3]|uniref:AMP-dependent synthetase/ligase domain-containing protein n=2 Tax=Serpula lacrymans var. lacrymans TaxID=341189 RepID=F8Q4E8_SERL3|nr:uncharacterized protein SERLADRAFT_362762 [Serpula lacrymans var. lacrymans S7.9]EGN97003.1 hypothetical protein SERLA73DRAFT_111801 [Serpula lacrymans var. lacrymans S7.3]EGO22594.1 hypothetical protein SERLADRAFT_362762 [Serpula lacrymans var. lacrymans S7.9]
MSHFSSHLTVLEQAATLYPSSPAFRVPRSDPTHQVQDWASISYKQFREDVECFARHWSVILKSDGIPAGSVVGLWHVIGGMTYCDVLQIYGLSRAGFVPQLFSIRLPNPVVVFELLRKSQAKALIYDSTFESGLVDCPVPVHRAADLSDVTIENHPLPDMPSIRSGDQLVFVFHTSGSTSGSPKLVPCTYSWLSAIIAKAKQAGRPRDLERQDVSVWMGSMCHIAQTSMLIGSLQYGSCTVQPTQIGFSTDELVDMIHRCHLNRLNQFSTFLAGHLRNARHNPKLLSLLRSLDEILYSGLPLNREEEEWAYCNGLKLKNLFGSTECGAMLLSSHIEGSDTAFLRPLEGVSYGFSPITPMDGNEANHQTNTQLLELVILAESGDCPHPSLRQSDGHFHTGDLFQEITPGSYMSRGRNDDWIKSENSLRCDAKAIEDNVRSTCANLIEECIVVGTGRPSPVLFIEPARGVDHNWLKREIIRKTRPFHSRRYLHERITSPNFIVVVPSKSLPRTATKGNIRRKAVEEEYKVDLDRLYSTNR